MTIDASLRQEMLDAIPHLRAFAISLTGNITYADDLVQTALMRGLEYLDKFQPGTNASLAFHHPAQSLLHRAA
jgi:RNA polymerase sigma-70 factor (ECF subfamily)